MTKSTTKLVHSKIIVKLLRLYDSTWSEIKKDN